MFVAYFSMLLHRKSVGDAMASMAAHGTSHNFQFDAVIPPGSSQDEVSFAANKNAIENICVWLCLFFVSM